MLILAQKILLCWAAVPRKEGFITRKTFIAAAIMVMLSANVEAAVVGTGYAPSNVTNPAQAKMLARRAAMIDCYRQLGSKAIQVVKEVWDGHSYTIEAESPSKRGARRPGIRRLINSMPQPTPLLFP